MRGEIVRFKKIKITSEKKIMMLFEKQSKSKVWDEYSLTCSEEARPEFYAAMQSLKKYVVEMCELPDDYLDRITVRGVSFSYAGMDEVMGATISAGMRLDDSYTQLNLNTPHKASGSYSGQDPDPMQVLSDKCIDALDILCEEAGLYVDGERAQMQLFGAA
ncbi:MAG: hypothetical protein H6Q72_924 [Firmicutes bacterium]|nr:hypothetical protein [Bacillota bacterium]